MDEKKEYSIVGTVTIGTDEYRDLLTAKFEAEKEAESQRSRFYEQYSKANELEKKVAALETEVKQLRRYIKDNNEQDKLELWIVKTSRDED